MLLIAVALLTETSPDRWVHLGGSANVHEEYLDKESIVRSGDKVTLWTRRDFKLQQGTLWNELELDCSMKTETILAYVRDDGETVSHNTSRPHREASPIPPNSIGEKIFNMLCR